MREPGTTLKQSQTSGIYMYFLAGEREKGEKTKNHHDNSIFTAKQRRKRCLKGMHFWRICMTCLQCFQKKIIKNRKLPMHLYTHR